MSNEHVLIVGTGSAGKRHARNLTELGCRISCMDPREDRRTELAAELSIVETFATMEEALTYAKKPDGIVIASPPSAHVDQAITALGAGIPVLLEKPVSPTLENGELLAAKQHETGVPLLLGYTWRWWPPLAEVRRLLAENTVGRLRHVNFIMSAHLADWHPWERYQNFFMAHSAFGGGALLDESHWVDLMLWFFGAPQCIFASVEKISDLEIDTDDNVDMLVSYGNGLRVTIHLDLFGRPHQKSIRIIGENGSILWNETPNRIAVGSEASEQWRETHFDCERNDMFMAVAREFLDTLRGEPVKTCSLADGIQVMRVIEAARESHRSGRVVHL